MGNELADAVKLALSDGPRLKRVVIFFTDMEDCHMLRGPYVDRMLSCDIHEQGFVVPERYRIELERSGFHFREVRRDNLRGSLDIFTKEGLH